MSHLHNAAKSAEVADEAIGTIELFLNTVSLTNTSPKWSLDAAGAGEKRNPENEFRNISGREQDAENEAYTTSSTLRVPSYEIGLGYNKLSEKGDFKMNVSMKKGWH